MPNILVVDDEKSIVELIKFNLEQQGWNVIEAFDGYAAIDAAIKLKPDVIVLDLMLPNADGFEVCRRLKVHKETEHIPIIMLSAKSEELDKVLGLEIGADDYMTKPFSPRELVARIKARLRKKDSGKEATEKSKVIEAGNLVMDWEKFEVYVSGVKVELTLKEFELLQLLMSNPGKVFTRQFLMERIWKYDNSNDSRTVDVHIRHVREKIEENPANPRYIETIRGLGYRFKDTSSSQ